MYEIYSIIIKWKIFCDNEKISINFYSEILSGIPIQIFGCSFEKVPWLNKLSSKGEEIFKADIGKK